MDTKARILRAATEEFARHGYAGARIDRIARQAKANKALIYYHFTSKENLYRCVLENQVKDVITYFESKMRETQNLQELLLAFSQKYHEAFRAGSRFVPMLLREMAIGGGHIRELVSQMIDSEADLRNRILRIIEDGKRKGFYRNLDSRHAIISFASMNLFYLFMAPLVNEIWGIQDEEAFRRERPHHIVDLFMDGLKR